MLVINSSVKRYPISAIWNPTFRTYSVDVEGGRALTRLYSQQHRIPLGLNTWEVLKPLHTLWKFPIVLQAIDMHRQITAEYHCPPIPINKAIKYSP